MTIGVLPTGGGGLASSAWKEPVRLASADALPGYTFAAGVAGNGELTAIAPGQLVIDGINTAVGDRVLIKDEVGANAPYNGIWIVASNGVMQFGPPLPIQYVLVRAVDAASTLLVANIVVAVSEGTLNSDTSWQLTTNNAIVQNVTNLTFGQFCQPVIVVQHVTALGATVLSPTYWRRVIMRTSAAGVANLTLPSVLLSRDGDTVEVKDADLLCAVNPITIAGDVFIDGAPALVMNVNGQSVTLVLDKVVGQWLVM